MNVTSHSPILVVEDSLEDFTALSRAFRKNAVTNPVLRCEDGEQALEYLQGHGKHPAWPNLLPALTGAMCLACSSATQP
jgi:CheY-like chemotaxis protein